MFKLIEITRNILKCDYIRYSPSEIGSINTANAHIFIIIASGYSVYSLLGSRLRANFGILHAATNNRYIDGHDIRLVKEGPIALFSKYKLQSSSGEQIEEINHAHIVCLMYKLITSSRITDDMSIGFDRDRGRRQRG